MAKKGKKMDLDEALKIILESGGDNPLRDLLEFVAQHLS